MDSRFYPELWVRVEVVRVLAEFVRAIGLEPCLASSGKIQKQEFSFYCLLQPSFPASNPRGQTTEQPYR